MREIIAIIRCQQQISPSYLLIIIYELWNREHTHTQTHPHTQSNARRENRDFHAFGTRQQQCVEGEKFDAEIGSRKRNEIAFSFNFGRLCCSLLFSSLTNSLFLASFRFGGPTKEQLFCQAPTSSPSEVSPLIPGH